ncbi:MAG: hypothetical protein NUV98_06600 [Candidatus Roizmanbacteria bacterium]|nr:hypothetical protein [Candidatus Roizmanbacteria bacterium]
MQSVDRRSEPFSISDKISLGITAILLATTLAIVRENRSGRATAGVQDVSGQTDRPSGTEPASEQTEPEPTPTEALPSIEVLRTCEDGMDLKSMQSPATKRDGTPVDDTIYYCEDTEGNREYLPDIE